MGTIQNTPTRGTPTMNTVNQLKEDESVYVLCWTFFPSPVGAGFWGKHIGNKFCAIVEGSNGFSIDFTFDSRIQLINHTMPSLGEAMEYAESIA